MTESLKKLYTDIFAQAFSPCGNYLCVGDTLGKLGIFDLSDVFKSYSDEDDAETYEPKIRVPFEINSRITTLQSSECFLIVGYNGNIAGYKWADLLFEKEKVQPAWVIQLPTNNSIESHEVICLLYDKNDELLYVGSTDTKVYVYDLDCGKIKWESNDHADYILDIDKQENNLAVSSFDGAVKIYDIRDRNVRYEILPHANETVGRPHIGNWIDSVSMNGNWLVCGGGPKLALWNMLSLSVAHVFDTNDSGIYVSKFYKDRILAGGTSRCLYQFNLDGTIYSEIPISSSTVYSVVYQEKPYKIMSISGASPILDICTQDQYRDRVLNFYNIKHEPKECYDSCLDIED